MIKYSIETLYHFQCTECEKWFSIGDYHLVRKEILTCPHCGHTTVEIEEIEPD